MSDTFASLRDPNRLAALRRLGLMDSPAEPAFDRMVRLARQFLRVPVSLVSLVDDERQFFKAAEGLGGEVAAARQTPLSHSFCQHVVSSGRALVVNDAREDALVRENLAVPELGVRAYLGCPIRTPDGFVLGSFCAIDHGPRVWRREEIELMEELTQLVTAEVAARYRNLGAEEALQASHDRLRQLLGWADCLIWEAEVELRGEAWSWRFNIQPSGLFHRLFGQRVPEANVGLWYRFALPEQAEMDRRSRAALVSGASGYEQEFRVVREGRTTWLREAVTIARLGPERFWLVGVATDKTEEREAELARRALEERMRVFVAHAPVSVAMFDREMRYLLVSRQWLTDYGLEGRELIGRSHYEVFPEIPERWKAHHRQCLAGEVVRSEADLFERANGARQWLSYEVRPWHEAGGGIGGIVMFTRDITERKALEDSFALARDQALEASRLKSEFLAAMSHEIRTPMNAVIGMGQVLTDTPLRPEQREMLRTMMGGAESLLAIIDDILDFSRIEAGRLRLDPEAFDPRRLLEETVAFLQARAEAKHLRLECAVDLPAGLRVLGDGGRVRQVLTNLVGNAVKFTEDGEVAVEVRAVAEGPGTIRVRVEVRDTGVGISAEAQARLFQPFVQADGGVTRRFGGTGLGLAISRQLVELMGGRIGLESAEGRGSTFWFELEWPRVDDVPAVAVGAGLPVAVRPLVLLIAEDDPANRRVAQLLLERMGHAVELVGDGAAALRRLAERRFDALLLDCQMPVLNGYETARRIRAGTEPGVRRDVPIVALTAYARAEDRVACRAAGMDYYVAKPIRPWELAAELARCVTGAPGLERAELAEPEAAVFEESVVATLRGVLTERGRTLWGDLVEMHLAEERETLERMEERMERREGEALALIAHRLAGGAAAFGALEVKRRALAVEVLARRGEWPAVPRGVAAVVAACKRLRLELALRGLLGG